VQPQSAAFPELVEMTGGGILYEPNDPQTLAETIDSLLLESGRAQILGATGRRVTFEKLSAEAMARNIVEAVKSLGNHTLKAEAPSEVGRVLD
jgi:glycosyltransferase involved in cell wall biosynthesis